MDADPPRTTAPSKPATAPLVDTASHVFLKTEQFIYIALGAVLSVAALIALAGTGKLIWEGLQDWTGTTAVFEIIDRLLFVLMLIEILYTIRASMESGALSAEPFLIVGLIACIRRILVISLETSNVTQADKWTPESADLFHASMIERGVLAGLVLVMVGAIC
jgi:uncharacterized membrane protein (DUF373 family)